MENPKHTIEYMKEDFVKSLDLESVAKKYGITKNRAEKMLSAELGMSTRQYIKQYNDDKRAKEIVAEFENGKFPKDIAINHGVSDERIRQILIEKLGVLYVNIKNNSRKKHYENPELEAVMVLAKKLGRIPNQTEAVKCTNRKGGNTSFYERYQGYVKLLKEKGYKTYKEKTRQRMIDRLVSFTIQNNRPPSSHEIQVIMKLDYKTYIGDTIKSVHRAIKKEMENKKC